VRESGLEPNPQTHRRPNRGGGQFPRLQEAHAKEEFRVELIGHEAHDEKTERSH